MKLRIALADDHPIVSNGIRLLLERGQRFRVVAEAASPDELLRALDEHPCDIAVTDFCMPGEHADGLKLIHKMHQLWPDLAIVVLTQIGTPVVLDAIYRAAGVFGVVSKVDALQELYSAVELASKAVRFSSRTIKEQLVVHGSLRKPEARWLLSPREAEVVRLFAAGKSVSDIAQMLGRSIKTISCQKQSAKRKLGVSNDLELLDSVREYFSWT